MRKGISIIAWIFALPFLLVGALWVWRGAARTANLAGAKSSGSTTAALPASTTAAKNNTTTPVQTTTLQDVTSAANAATSLLSALGSLIPSNNDYQPDPTEAMTSAGESAVPTADISALFAV